jgi:preprotein translocase subunit YajC
MKKGTIVTILSLAVVYAGIYFYQRYQRQKANERKANLKEADEIIDNL